MNEQDVRKIANEVYEQRSKQEQFFSLTTSNHSHNGIDAPRISQENVIPNTRASGSITFANTGTYILNINSNPNPTLILCYGIVVDDPNTPTIRAHVYGSAQLGETYYFQPTTSNSVTVGGPVQQFIQSSSYLSVSNTGVVHALTDEGHLVDVEYPKGTIHARMTVTAYDTNTVTLNVSNLDAGWNIIVNLVVI